MNDRQIVINKRDNALIKFYQRTHRIRQIKHLEPNAILIIDLMRRG